MYATTSERILASVIVALGEDAARDFHAAYRSGDDTARFVDAFIAEAIEAGLVDAEDHTDSETWRELVDELWNEPADA